MNKSKCVLVTIFTIVLWPSGYIFIGWLDDYLMENISLSLNGSLTQGDFIATPTILGWIISVIFSFIISFLLISLFRYIKAKSIKKI